MLVHTRGTDRRSEILMEDAQLIGVQYIIWDQVDWVGSHATFDFAAGGKQSIAVFEDMKGVADDQHIAVDGLRFTRQELSPRGSLGRPPSLILSSRSPGLSSADRGTMSAREEGQA